MNAAFLKALMVHTLMIRYCKVLVRNLAIRDCRLVPPQVAHPRQRLIEPKGVATTTRLIEPEFGEAVAAGRPQGPTRSLPFFDGAIRLLADMEVANCGNAACVSRTLCPGQRRKLWAEQPLRGQPDSMGISFGTSFPAHAEAST